ncbi:VOC family protein [Yinghuangia seranimata]|uniref:VOC family protein n=1 Tax=Yinghuangia seranimata TaxID=408067 RepID=UPI00248AE576|nr:VOC family protein [Yinghuangia seranimata]MDI2125750.1 VOC family protein [Yinghuangia seranimata]
MAVELNHTIVYARDRHESARFLADVLGLEVGADWGPFTPVELSNGVTLDYATLRGGEVAPQHYAFLISEAEFDAAFGRIQDGGVEYFADPMRTRVGMINHNDGGRGVYFMDPSGHGMELITRPYGSGQEPGRTGV